MWEMAATHQQAVGSAGDLGQGGECGMWSLTHEIQTVIFAEPKATETVRSTPPRPSTGSPSEHTNRAWSSVEQLCSGQFSLPAAPTPNPQVKVAAAGASNLVPVAFLPVLLGSHLFTGTASGLEAIMTGEFPIDSPSSFSVANGRESSWIQTLSI